MRRNTCATVQSPTKNPRRLATNVRIMRTSASGGASHAIPDLRRWRASKDKSRESSCHSSVHLRSATQAHHIVHQPPWTPQQARKRAARGEPKNADGTRETPAHNRRGGHPTDSNLKPEKGRVRHRRMHRYSGRSVKGCPEGNHSILQQERMPRACQTQGRRGPLSSVESIRRRTYALLAATPTPAQVREGTDTANAQLANESGRRTPGRDHRRDPCGRRRCSPHLCCTHARDLPPRTAQRAPRPERRPPPPHICGCGAQIHKS